MQVRSRLQPEKISPRKVGTKFEFLSLGFIFQLWMSSPTWKKFRIHPWPREPLETRCQRSAAIVGQKVVRWTTAEPKSRLGHVQKYTLPSFDSEIRTAFHTHSHTHTWFISFGSQLIYKTNSPEKTDGGSWDESHVEHTWPFRRVFLL